MTPLAVPLPTRRATIELARLLAPRLAGGDLVVLSGDLGSGKTFFVRALARALGVPHDHEVTSPTFTLVHELEGRTRAGSATSVAAGANQRQPFPITHVDAYRLGSARELEQLGLLERRADGSLLLVEWGEPYERDLGGDAVVLTLVHAGQGRAATLRATGARATGIVAALAEALATR